MPPSLYHHAPQDQAGNETGQRQRVLFLSLEMVMAPWLHTLFMGSNTGFPGPELELPNGNKE